MVCKSECKYFINNKFEVINKRFKMEIDVVDNPRLPRGQRKQSEFPSGMVAWVFTAKFLKFNLLKKNIVNILL